MCQTPSRTSCKSLIKEDFEIEGCDFEGEGGWIRHKQTAGGRKLAIVEVPSLPKLRLKGQPAGYTSLGDESLAFEGLQWPSNEVEEWEKESGNKARVGVVEALPTPKQSSSKKNNSSTSNNSTGNSSTDNSSTGNSSTGNSSTGNTSTGNNSAGNSSTGFNFKVPFTLKERRWLLGAYGGDKPFLQKYNITDASEAKRLVRSIMQQFDDDDDVTEGRIRARAILQQQRETRNPAEARRLEEGARMARMMLQMAPENAPFIDQRDDSD